MPPFAIAIEKSISWRGQPEITSNVYHYDNENPMQTDAGWNDLANQIAAAEKLALGNGMTWKGYRVWGPTHLGPQQSKMIAEGTLSGTGSQSGALVYPEFAVVCSFFLGRSPDTNRKRFLRKYYHTSSLPTGATTSEASGTAQLSSATKAPFVTLMNSLKNLTVGGFAWALCAPNGDHLPLGSSPKVLDYLHIRQLRQ